MFDTCSHGNIAITCPACRSAGRIAQVAAAPDRSVALPVRAGGQIAAGVPGAARAYLIREWPTIMESALNRVLSNRSDPDGHGQRYLSPAQARARAEAEGIPFA